MKDLIEFIGEVKSRKEGKINNLILSDFGVQLLKEDIDCCNRMIEMIRKQKKPIKLYEANIKWIEDIIEIVMDDVSCDHQVDSDGAGKRYDDVIYTLNDEQKVVKKCLEAIPEIPIEFDIKIDTKYIEEKTMEMIDIVSKGKILESMSFIRLLIKELMEKIKFNGGKK